MRLESTRKNQLAIPCREARPSRPTRYILVLLRRGCPAVPLTEEDGQTFGYHTLTGPVRSLCQQETDEHGHRLYHTRSTVLRDSLFRNPDVESVQTLSTIVPPFSPSEPSPIIIHSSLSGVTYAHRTDDTRVFCSRSDGLSDCSSCNQRYQVRETHAKLVSLQLLFGQ